MKEQYTYKFTDKGLEEYVKSIREAAVLAEREACAKVCDEQSKYKEEKMWLGESVGADDCAAAIRARSNNG